MTLIKKIKVLCLFLKAGVLLWMSVGRVFRAMRTALLNAHLPNMSDVCGMSKSFFFVNGRDECVVSCSAVVCVTTGHHSFVTDLVNQRTACTVSAHAAEW